MSENGWTKGPWRLEIVKGSYKRPCLVKAGDKLVANCMGDQLDPDAASIREATANGHLIAASPALAEALEEMLAAHSMENIGVAASLRRTEATKAARAALESAKGRTV